MANGQVVMDSLNRVLSLGNECMKPGFHEKQGYYKPEVMFTKYAPFKAAALALLQSLGEPAEQHYSVVVGLLDDRYVHKVEGAIAVLSELKHAIENGYLESYRSLVTATLFSDYLEMAEHLLEENYKDPAAVLVGSTLEEHLRQLCKSKGIALEGDNGKPKKAEMMNDELYKKDVYNLLDKKNVTAWLDLRNKAAHGRYDEYNEGQVLQLLTGVREFIARVK